MSTTNTLKKSSKPAPKAVLAPSTSPVKTKPAKLKPTGVSTVKPTAAPPVPVCVLKAKSRTAPKTPAEELGLLFARYQIKFTEMIALKKRLQDQMMQVELKFIDDKNAIATKHKLTSKELAKMVRELKKTIPAA